MGPFVDGLSASPFAAGSRGLNPGWVAVPQHELDRWARIGADATQQMSLLLGQNERLQTEVTHARAEAAQARMTLDLMAKAGLTSPAPPASVQSAEGLSARQMATPTEPIMEVAPDLGTRVEVDQPSDPVNATTSSTKASSMASAKASSTPSSAEFRSPQVAPPDQVWPRPDDPIANLAPIVAGATRACHRVLDASAVAPGALRRWVAVTSRRTSVRAVGRLEHLAELARALPRCVTIQPLTKDLLGSVGMWMSEIEGPDAAVDLRVLVALDAIASTGLDPGGRLFDAAAAVWRARADAIVSAREYESLLTIATSQTVAALVADQAKRARMFAEVVRALSPSVHPDPVLRARWLGRAIVGPLRDADVDVGPVRGILTEAVQGLFGRVFEGPPAMTFGQDLDLYLSCVEADLETCVEARAFDECLRGLLLRLGVSGLSRMTWEPTILPRKARGKAAPLVTRPFKSGRLCWALRELGLSVDGSWTRAQVDAVDVRTDRASTTCTWAPPICRQARRGRRVVPPAPGPSRQTARAPERSS